MEENFGECCSPPGYNCSSLDKYDPVGSGEPESDDYYWKQRAKWLEHREEVEEKERPFHQANNILGSLGKKSISNGVTKRTFTSKGLILEDISVETDLAGICKMVHDSLVIIPDSDPKKIINYELKIYQRENPIKNKVLKYHATFGSSNELHTFDKGDWQNTLSEIVHKKSVAYHPCPANIMHYCV